MKTKLTLLALATGTSLVLSSCGAIPGAAMPNRTVATNPFLGGRMYESNGNNFMRGILNGSALNKQLTVGHSYRQKDGSWVKYLGNYGSVGGAGMPYYSLQRFQDLGMRSPVRRQAAPVVARAPYQPSVAGNGYGRSVSIAQIPARLPSGYAYTNRPLTGNVNANYQPGHQSGGMIVDAPR